MLEEKKPELVYEWSWAFVSPITKSIMRSAYFVSEEEFNKEYPDVELIGKIKSTKRIRGRD